MKNYLRNIGLWLGGWARMDEVQFKDGWHDGLAWRLVYLIDYLPCVLFLAGAVEPPSGFMQRHRHGWLNDKVLDAIEAIDDAHGKEAGGPLWGSVPSPRPVRIAVPVLWVLIVVLWKLG